MTAAGSVGGRASFWVGLGVVIDILCVATAWAGFSVGVRLATMPVDTAPPPGARAIPAPDAGPATASGSTRLTDLTDGAVVGLLGSATVDLTVFLGIDASAGTGIVISSSGLVLTDAHVVRGATVIAGQVGGRGPTYRAALVGVDRAADVALLQLEHASGLSAARMGDSAAVAVWDRVVAMGYPDSGRPLPVRGQVEALDESTSFGTPPRDFDGLLVMVPAAEPGFEGGPLLDASARVVGMTEAVTTDETHFIPIGRVLEAARRIASRERKVTASS